MADADAQVQEASRELATERASLVRRIAAQSPAPSKPADAGASSGAARTPEVAAALLATTRQIAADQKTLASVDNRSTTERDLAGVYEAWRAIVAPAPNISSSG